MNWIDDFDLPAYLERLGINTPQKPTLSFLNKLQERHLLSIPFENLNIHLGLPICLDIPSLFDKIVRKRRGGFCYELNFLFYALLTVLGYDPILVSARVKKPQGGFGPEFDHLALIVHLPEPYLVDVGFGNSSRQPLPLSGETREDISGTYRVKRLDHGEFCMQQRNDGNWSDEYLFTLVPRTIDEFQDMCLYHQTSPDSHFTRNKICSIATPYGRLTLTGTELIVTENGKKETYPVSSEEEWNRLLVDRFGIRL